ncbi:MAG: 3-methyl-2-oxobutanoate dehydrogenase subunit VorB [Anaerolineae bacterium]|nr:3-methyl-2-oxobutanoate dehydrogenase subunit VorB [Anaerolineae bacterium]
MPKEMLKGNMAIAEAAVRAGLEAYFGYPITPQTEMLEHLSVRLNELGRVFLQAESEIAAIHMVYGAACGGARVMTSSSSPGFSLMQEGLSYIAASDLPCVVVDMMRGGPGLGNIQPSQADYFQVTRSAGHGDYHPIVLAPASIQEAIDFTVLAFDLADQYRHLVILAADGLIGQMMEAAELPPMQPLRSERPDYALTGAEGRKKRLITSVYMQAEAEAAYNQTIQNRLRQIKRAEQRSTEYRTEDADLLVVGYGTSGRIARSAVDEARARGLRVGLFRPQTLWPFPEERLSQLLERVRGCLVVEMNAGQMLDDVRLVAQGHIPVGFYGQMGGLIPDTEDIVGAIDAEYARWSRPQPVVTRSLVGEMP